MVRGFFFKLYAKTIKDQMTPKQCQELDKKSGISNFTPFKSYENTVFLKFQQAAVDTLYPNDSPQVQYEKLGSLVAKTFLNNPIGSAFKQFANKDTGLLLKQIPQTAKMVSADLEVSVQFNGHNNATLLVKHAVSPPEYYSGIFKSGIAQLHSTPIQITYTKQIQEPNNRLTYEYQVNWT